MTSFNHLTCLVTKPKARAQYLLSQLQQRHSKVILFPTIEFIEPPQSKLAEQAIKNLKYYDIAIFTSPTAVTKTFNLIKKHHITIPEHLQFATVGSSSAQCLMQAGIKTVIYPTQHLTSEGLLAMPLLNKVTHKQFVIFTGMGGRALLNDTLTQRGATVNIIPVYQRTTPKVANQSLSTDWRTAGVNLIITTSQEGLENLWAMVDSDTKNYLANLPLLIIHPKMQAIAKSLGHHGKILLSENATDQAILATIEDWIEQGTDHV